MMNKHYRPKLKMLSRRMRNELFPYWNRGFDQTTILQHYTAQIAGIAPNPEIITVSWVENFLYVMPLADYSTFTDRQLQVMSWAAQSLQNDTSLYNKLEMEGLLEHLRRINSDAVINGSEYFKRFSDIYGSLPHPEPVGLKIKDEDLHIH